MIPDETKVLELPSGKKATLKAYITGADKRANRRLILSLGETDTNRADVLEAVENKNIEQIVLELDGTKENIVERVVGLPAADYEAILEAVAEVVSGMDKKKENT